MGAKSGQFRGERVYCSGRTNDSEMHGERKGGKWSFMKETVGTRYGDKGGEGSARILGKMWVRRPLLGGACQAVRLPPVSVVILALPRKGSPLHPHLINIIRTTRLYDFAAGEGCGIVPRASTSGHR